MLRCQQADEPSGSAAEWADHEADSCGDGRHGVVGAQAAIWDQIRQARHKGLAVLLISADLDELIGLSDSLKVILRGRFVGDFDPQTVTPQQLGSAMTGAGAKS